MIHEDTDLDCSDADTVQCHFFCAINDQKALNQLCNSINETIESVTKGYIWHQDEFKVKIPLSHIHNTDLPLHLFSSTCFGDNIEDEWLIVYLVFELTKKHPNLIVKVVDSDGDFLLIEAANYLPDWLNADTSQNRVYIHRNELHIIPRSFMECDTKISINDAISCITKGQELTIAKDNIQEAIKTKIENMPEIYQNSFHNAMVTLPIDIATVLILQPGLVAGLVHAYCQHDIIDVKTYYKKMADQLVTVKIKFTKCLYAMIIHAKPINDRKPFKNNETDKRVAIGDKLAFGFQILVSQSTSDIYASKAYSKFLDNLKSSGYFQNNLEHSQQYNYLLRKAKDFFTSTETPLNSYICQKINSAMGTTEFQEIKTLLLSRETENDVSDNDGWLHIDPEHLNRFLNTRYGQPANIKNEDVETAEKLTNKLSNFLNETSDYEGIEQNCELSSDRVDFDPNDFINSVEKMLKLMSTDGEHLSDSDCIDSDDEDNSHDSDLNTDIDKELSIKLKDSHVNNAKNNNSVLLNIKRSIKEEKGFSGPSSNVLNNIGVNKTDLLYESDDDC